MGNQQHNGVVIQLESDAIFTGEMLRGKIECWGEELSKVVLHIKGYEKTSLSKKQRGCLSENRNDGVYIFYQHEYVIHEFQDYGLQGNKKEIFPFQFIVDSSLPGSLKLKEKPIRGKISYSLRAVLHSKKGTKFTKCHFQIMEQPSTILGRKEYVLNAQIDKYYLMKHGNTRIQCCINQHQFLVGDDVILELFIDNSECDIDINGFSINLIKYANIYNLKDEVKSYDEILQTIRIAGINAGLKYSVPQKQNIKLIDPENRIKPSVNGSLIDQNYCIGIQVNVSAFNVFNSKPQLLIPIQIYARLSQKKGSEIHTLGQNYHPVFVKNILKLTSLVVQRKPEKSQQLSELQQII